MKRFQLYETTGIILSGKVNEDNNGRIILFKVFKWCIVIGYVFGEQGTPKWQDVQKVRNEFRK